MGFIWSVIIAHLLVSSIVRSSFTLILQLSSFLSCPSFNPSLSLFQRSLAPFLLQASSSIAFIINDDISVTFNDWTDQDVSTFHFCLSVLLRKSEFPVSEYKSLPPHLVETEVIPFIGCNIELFKRIVFPMSDKISKITAFSRRLKFREALPQKWESLVGKLIFYAMLIHPILSAFQKFYEGTPRRVCDLLALITSKDPLFNPTSSHMLDLESIISLTPLWSVPIDLPFFKTVLALDASHTAGAALKTAATLQTLKSIYEISMRRSTTKDITPVIDPDF